MRESGLRSRFFVHLCAVQLEKPVSRPIGRGGIIDFDIPAFVRRGWEEEAIMNIRPIMRSPGDVAHLLPARRLGEPELRRD
ncbi:MAG: hypothetical protein A3F74_00295 [Betaproteobacteria bacterium RIFCSPLOWO2_12_FULL_62_58]|nr:MAG: hypothetical protein A3F74_00295 [Betaproteobacteria bacterium RIFCSPLOWO2_12_FULL_62_58]